MKKHVGFVVVFVLSVIVFFSPISCWGQWWPGHPPGHSTIQAQTQDQNQAQMQIQGQTQGQGQNQSLSNSPTTSQSMSLSQSYKQERPLLELPPMPTAPLINYWGPHKEPATILESSVGFPGKVTYQQALIAHKGGTKARVNLLNPVGWSVDSCELLGNVPDKAVTRGFAFIQGGGDASTIDLLMRAFREAMDSGASKMVILKRAATGKTTAFGASLGIGGGVSSVVGQDKDRGLAVGGGTGLSWGSTESKFKESMAILMLE